MISFEEANKIIRESIIHLGSEEVPLRQSLHRVLAEDVISDIEMPPFNKSAVDGYACKKADIQKELEVIEIIPAGNIPEKKITTGQCAKIMTGAVVPEGADTVLMVEYTEETAKNKIRFLKDKTNSNICYQAEDVKNGQKVLTSGIFIEPQHIAVMASVGYSEVFVAKQPGVGIISTGDELVEPSEKPGISQIRNSNAWQLIGQVERMNAIPDYLGIASDDRDATFQMINKAFEKNDVVLLTGGVSMGDYDFVPGILEECGLEILFKSIAVQPGRPTLFGKKENKFCFGLPGDPVSSFGQFEQIGRAHV